MLSTSHEKQIDCLDHPLEPTTAEYFESLISDFSHDFRGQLSSLLLNIYLMERQQNGHSSEKLQQLKDAIGELNHLVTGIRSASHPCEAD